MKKTIWTVTGILAVIGLLFINAKTTQTGGYQVGSEAKDFSLPNIDGKKVSMADFKDAKGFIVIFTCNTCPYAKAYEQRFVELDKKSKALGYPVIAINPNDLSQQPGDSMEEMGKRAKERGFTFPYLRDDSQEITKLYGATKTPHIYLLNKSNGKLLVEYIGALDDSPREEGDVTERYVEDAISALLKGEKPAVTNKRAIGCTIKWTNS